MTDCEHTPAHEGRTHTMHTAPAVRRPLPDTISDFERDTDGRALLPTNLVRLDDVRAALSGYHFTQEALSDATRQVLFCAEALLAELDRRHGGFAR